MWQNQIVLLKLLKKQYKFDEQLEISIFLLSGKLLKSLKNLNKNYDDRIIGHTYKTNKKGNKNFPFYFLYI